VSTVEEQSHDVRIVFTATKTWFGRLIRWLTGGKVSHVFLEYDSSLWGGRWVAEATVGGVRKVPAYKVRHNIVYEYRVKLDSRVPCRAIARYFGNAYDYAGIFIFGWFIIAWKWFKLKVRRPYRSTKSQVCSELIARWVIAYGVPGTQAWDPEQVTPQMIADICFANQLKFFARIGLE
jgi:hypothetical protein